MNVTRFDSMSSSACSGSHFAMKHAAERHDAGQGDAVEQAGDVRARRGHEHAVAGAAGRGRAAISAALYARVAWVCSTPFGAPLDPEVNSTAASCSRFGPGLGDRFARRAARRGRRRPAAARPRRVARSTSLRAELMVQRCGDRAEPPARAVQHRDLVAVGRLPRDRIARGRRRARADRRRRARRVPPARGTRPGSAARRATGRSHAPPRRAVALGPTAYGTSVRARGQARRDFQPSLAGVAPLSTLVPMKLRWISTVPAPMHRPRMSRYTRSTGYSREKP